MKQLIILICAALTLGSCSQYGKKSKETAEAFFAALKNDNDKGMKEAYPQIANLYNYFKSDEAVITDAKSEGDNKYIVFVKSTFTNGFGKKFERSIELFLMPSKDKEKMIIYDSKGMFDKNEIAVYSYGKKMGFIADSLVTDQQISKQLRIIDKAIVSKAVDINLMMPDYLKVKNIDWYENDYDYGAHGSFVVYNISNITFKDIKYTIIYKKNGNEVTRDDGVLCYGEFRPGESKSESFYTDYAAHATSCRIDINLSIEDIYNAIIDSEYPVTL